MKFKDLSGNVVHLLEISKLIESDFEYKTYIGTDSQIHRNKNKILYATCIVLYKKGRGGQIFVAKNWDRNVKLKQRLMNETWKSLEVSFFLREILPSSIDIIIHLDVNYKHGTKSSNYHQELIGMVTGQGFKCVIKPDSFAAMSVADRFSK